MTSDIGDLIRSAVGIGTGALLTKRSYRQPDLPPRLAARRAVVARRMGIFLTHGWQLQTPLFSISATR